VNVTAEAVGNNKYIIELVSASDTTATIKVTDANGNSESKTISEGTSKIINGEEVSVQTAAESKIGLSAEIDISGMSLKLP